LTYHGPDVHRCLRCGTPLPFSYPREFCEKCSKAMVSIVFPSLEEEHEAKVDMATEPGRTKVDTRVESGHLEGVSRTNVDIQGAKSGPQGGIPCPLSPGYGSEMSTFGSSRRACGSADLA
jgi:hypothetical protein